MTDLLKTVPPSVRLKFSDKQILQFVIGPGDWKRTLNLDNVAMYELLLWEPGSVTLIRSTARTTSAAPEPGEQLVIPGVASVIPSAGSRNVVLSRDSTGEGLITLVVGQTREITVDNRTFRVRLASIDLNRTTDDRVLREFVFSISEK